MFFFVTNAIKNNLAVYNAVPPLSPIIQPKLHKESGLSYGSYKAALNRLLTRGFLAKLDDGSITRTRLFYRGVESEPGMLPSEPIRGTSCHDESSSPLPLVQQIALPASDDVPKKRVLYHNCSFELKECRNMSSKITGWFNDVDEWESTVLDNYGDDTTIIENGVNGYKVIAGDGTVQTYKCHASDDGDGVVFR